MKNHPKTAKTLGNPKRSIKKGTKHHKKKITQTAKPPNPESPMSNSRSAVIASRHSSPSPQLSWHPWAIPGRWKSTAGFDDFALLSQAWNKCSFKNKPANKQTNQPTNQPTKKFFRFHFIKALLSIPSPSNLPTSPRTRCRRAPPCVGRTWVARLPPWRASPR